jgi:nitronate monooxygenase
MAGVSGGLLAAETCRAGALGFIAAGHSDNLEQIEDQVKLFSQSAPKDAPLAIGFISHSTCKNGDFSRLEHVLKHHHPQVVQFFAPAIVESKSQTNIDLAHHYHAKVLVQIGSVREAREAIDAGVDGIIAQGSEAGGHGLRRDLGNGTLSLAARVAKIASEIPVLAAGGIVDGRGLAAALALGCDGIVLGTRLLASKEALGREDHKHLLTLSEPDDCIRTTVVDQIANSYSAWPWPDPFDSVGVLRNDLTKEWDSKSHIELEASLDQLAYLHQNAVKHGDMNFGRVYAGEGVGDIESVESAFDIIRGIHEEATRIVTSMPKFIEHPSTY